MPDTLKCQNILTTNWKFQPGILTINDGKIIHINESVHRKINNREIIDLGENYLIPGLIDIHTHGGFGVAFGEGNLYEGLQKYSQQIVHYGVCGFVMSIAAPSTEALLEIIRQYVQILRSRPHWPGAVPYGLHLEGPLLNPKKHGGFNPTWLRSLKTKEINLIIETSRGWIKHVSMAPEMENADQVATTFKRAGIVVSLGHSTADYDTALAALSNQFSLVTHTFNAQSSFHHRSPGVVGAVLASDRAMAELIGDPNHVHPAAMKVLYRCLGPQRIVLISDAMPGAGLPDGQYELVGQKVNVHNGVPRLPDGTLAGSAIFMDASLRNLIQLSNVPLAHAARMASYNPAKVIGIAKHTGSLRTGKDGSMVLLDMDFHVVKTWVKGKMVYERGIP